MLDCWLSKNVWTTTCCAVLHYTVLGCDALRCAVLQPFAMYLVGSPVELLFAWTGAT